MKGIFSKNINQALCTTLQVEGSSVLQAKISATGVWKTTAPSAACRLHRAAQGRPSLQSARPSLGLASPESRGLLQGLRQQHRAQSTAPLQGLPLPLNWTPPPGKAPWISPQSSVLCLADKKELNSFPDILVKLQHYNYGSKHYKTFWWVFNKKY